VEFDTEIEVENEKLQVYSISTDKLMIDEIINSFFKDFNNKKNKLPNWDLPRNICISEIKIINKRGTSYKVYNLDLFIEPRKKLLSDGALQEFEEREIYEEPKIIASIAQRYTGYEKTGIIEGKPFRQHGYKLFSWSKQKLHGKLVQ